MALALLLQRAGKNSKPGKGENFGCKFHANFILESCTAKPYGKLAGHLVIESAAPILHYGIRIQYEAVCTLKFDTKLDSRVKSHCKCGNILGPENKATSDGYTESPIFIDLKPFIQANGNDSRPYELQAGTNTFKFNLNVPGDMLPAPFKNSYGTLFYKLTAYMNSETGVVVQIGEKVLKFGGYYNLSVNPAASKSVILERSVKRSMFTGKKLVMVKLKLDCCGYLPEELLRFTMEIQNPKCLTFKMGIQLLQKVSYSVEGTKKTTVAIIGSAEKEIAEPESETVWDGSFKIHKMASPTYAGNGKNPMYTVSHVAQFKVKLDDYSAIKADQVVYIGTTRDTVETLIECANNIDLTSENRSAERRGSNSSTSSKPATISPQTMSSIETLSPDDSPQQGMSK